MKRKGYAEQLVQLRTGRDVPDLLTELYVSQRHSQQEIADAIGVSRSQVQQWLRRYSISRDDRRPVEIEAVS